MKELTKCTVPKEFCNMRDKSNNCVLVHICKPVIDKCKAESEGAKDCSKIEVGYCKAYISPESKWKAGRECPLADHLLKESKNAGKRRVGQQKQKRH